MIVLSLFIIWKTFLAARESMIIFSSILSNYLFLFNVAILYWKKNNMWLFDFHVKYSIYDLIGHYLEASDIDNVFLVSNRHKSFMTSFYLFIFFLQILIDVNL